MRRKKKLQVEERNEKKNTEDPHPQQDNYGYEVPVRATSANPQPTYEEILWLWEVPPA